MFPAHSQHWLSLSPWPCSHPPVYPILLSPGSAHSCSSLGGRLGGPQDMVPCPGSSPAICHPLARIKCTGISWPPAEMPVGWEGKLRHEAGRSEATQGAGSGAQRRLHAQFILFKVIFFSPAGTALPLTLPLPARAAPGWTSATAFPRGASRVVPLTAGSSSCLETPRRALTSRASRRDAGQEPTLPSPVLFPRWTGSRTRRDESPSSSSPPASSWGTGQPLWCPSPWPGGRPRAEGAAGCVQQCGE